VCCHILLHSARLIRRHRRLEVVSFLDVRSVPEQSVLQDCMPLAQADEAVVAAVLVAERLLLLQIVPIVVDLGMNVLKLCSLLEDGSVFQWQSSPVAELQDS